jgi:uncharacterized membrane protein
VSVLVAIAYPDEHRAAEVLATVQRLRAAEPDGVTDAAVVVRRLDAQITLQQSQDLSGGGGAQQRVLWEALTALLVLAPPSAVVGGAALRAALTRLEDLGVSESFAVRLCACLPPASSAIWLVVDDPALPAVLGLLRPFGGSVLHVTLAG